MTFANRGSRRDFFLHERNFFNGLCFIEHASAASESASLQHRHSIDESLPSLESFRLCRQAGLDSEGGREIRSSRGLFGERQMLAVARTLGRLALLERRSITRSLETFLLVTGLVLGCFRASIVVLRRSFIVRSFARATMVPGRWGESITLDSELGHLTVCVIRVMMSMFLKQ